MSAKDDIFAAGKLGEALVDTPEWPVKKVLVLELRALERAEYQAQCAADAEARKPDLHRPRLAAWSSFDPETRTRIFDPKNEAELIRLATQGSRVIDRLALVADRLSWTTASEVTRILGKVEPTEAGSSSSDSPSE